MRHIRDGWNILSPEMGEYVEVLPPMKRVHSDWYPGTADAVFQNFQSIEAESPEVTLLSADHIYKMNEMIDWHRQHGADITLGNDTGARPKRRSASLWKSTPTSPASNAGHPVPRSSTPRHGQRLDRIYARPPTFTAQLPGRGQAQDPNSSHDFGKDVIPRNLDKVRVIAYDFRDINAKQSRYWRDVGTLDAYYEANMDSSASPPNSISRPPLPIRPKPPSSLPAAKFVFAQEGRRASR